MKGSKINREQMERYRREGAWGTRTLADCWEEAVREYPDREYVVDDRGNRYTYAGLDEKASRVAAYLVSQGIGPEMWCPFRSRSGASSSSPPWPS